MDVPVWVLAVLGAGILVGVALVSIKRIRRHERKDLDAPDLILTEDGRLDMRRPDEDETEKPPPE